MEEAAADRGAVAGDAAVRTYSTVQGLLRYFNSVGEEELRAWLERRSARELAGLEARLRERAAAAFETAKYELARSGARSSIRTDLLRPLFAEMTSTEVHRRFAERRGADGDDGLAEFLSELSGCSPGDAAALLRFARSTSELFAPVEMASRVARQDWHGGCPFALGVALLPALERALRGLRQAERPRVVVLGGCGITVAAACRLGCDVEWVEPRGVMRRVLQQLLEDNGVSAGVSLVGQASADRPVDVLVCEGLDDNAPAELSCLAAVGRLLREAPRPALVPRLLCVWVALADDGLPSVRGLDLTRLERLRGFDLAMPRRWPRGACRLQVRLRSPPQRLWRISLEELGRRPPAELDRQSLSFPVDPEAPVTCVALWVGEPDAEWGDEPPEDAPEQAYLACLQALPPRRAAGRRPLVVEAFRTTSRLWFDWAEDAAGDASSPVYPPVGKTVLPPWHFKMLNDHVRNRAYDAALSAAIRARRRASVVDCGCGAGLLSLLASRAGAGEVCALELSDIIADITQETLAADARARGDEAAAVRLLAGDVRRFSSEQVGRHDVVVCELMDASGVGESVLSVLRHACAEFAAPGAQVIPCGLELRGGLGFVRLPGCHGALDFAALDPFFLCASARGGPFGAGAPPAELRAGGVGAAEPRPPTLQAGPFASKNLNRLPRGECWELLTVEERFLDFDLASALHGGSVYPREAAVDLLVTQRGVVNCIMWWWTAQLDERERLSNRPVEMGGGYQTHWHQPMVPIGPLQVEVGDRLRLRVVVGDAGGQKLSFTLSPMVCAGWPSPGCAPPPRSLAPEPLEGLLEEWRGRWEEACAANNALVSKFTSRGDLAGLAQLQRAALAVVAEPGLFGCDPLVRDRLLLTYAGVSFK